MNNQPLIVTLLNTAFAVSAAVPARNTSKVYLHLMPEIGELAEEVLIHAGELYKSAGPDGVVGEACDVINCLADLFWLRTQAFPEALSPSTERIAEGTGIESLGTALVYPFESAKRYFMTSISNTSVICQMTAAATCPPTRLEIAAVADLINVVLSLAKAADPKLDDATFTAIFEAKCRKWLSKATGSNSAASPAQPEPMFNLTRARMTGACRSGGDSRGRVVHLIDNPDERPLALLGEALCGAVPRLDWSDSDLSPSHATCPKCERKLKAMIKASSQKND